MYIRGAVFRGGTYMMVHFGSDGDKDYHYDTPPSRRIATDYLDVC